MNILAHLTGKRFEALIKYFSESKDNINSKESYTYKCALEFINRKNIFPPLAPPPVSTVFLTLFLMLAFMFPCQTITYMLELSPPNAALVIYPLLLIVTSLMIITMRSTMMGNMWPMLIYKYIYIIDVILFLIPMIFSHRTEKTSFWVVAAINTGAVVWARMLLNSNSFFRLQEYFLHRKLSKLIIENSLKAKQNLKKNKKEKEIIKNEKRKLHRLRK